MACSQPGVEPSGTKAFDARLRAGLADADLEHLGDLLGQLAANAGGADLLVGEPRAMSTAISRSRRVSG
jgi:hypothetical protein